MPKREEPLSLESLGLKVPPPFVPRPEILLHPNVPKPMHGVAPRVVLGEKWWDQEKAAARAKAGGKCTACSVNRFEAAKRLGPPWLECHELYDIDYKAGRMVYVETVALCHYCHCFIHDGRTRVMYETGKITLELYLSIMNHGQIVLKMAKLENPRPYAGKCAAWAKWRMVVNGIEYPPKYSTEAEWLAEYGGRR